MKFKKKQLQELLRGGDSGGLETIVDEMASSDRWTISHDLVFKNGEKFYQTWYRRGATEQQDEGPFEYEPEEIECEEVKPVEKTVIHYVKV